MPELEKDMVEATPAAVVVTAVAWRPPTGLLSAMRQAVTVLLGATAVTWLLRLLIDRDPVQGAWAGQVMLALATLMGALWDVNHRRRHWQRPMAQLIDLLPQVRKGEAAVESLSGLPGGLAPLVPAIQDVLRDLREQKAKVAQLEAEMRERVAVRTSALERVIGSLRQQATRDPLTGLFNRRFLDDYLPQALHRSRSERTDLCVLMIDVDNFKLLNDTHGHAAGDELLRAVGQLIRSTIRGEDVAFRCGGDEFVVLMPGCDLESGRILADRLTSLVDALSRTIRVDAPPRLSIGLASLSELSAPTASDLLAAADRELYAVKAQRHGSTGVRRGRSYPTADLNN